MMELEAAYCELDAARAEYAKLAKIPSRRQKKPREIRRLHLLKARRRLENKRNRMISWLLMSSPTNLP